MESKKRPGSVGWWVICGDLPTDYVSAAAIKHPRAAIRSIAEEWREQARPSTSQERRDDIRIACPADWQSLALLLDARASLLLGFASEESVWQDGDAL